MPNKENRYLIGKEMTMDINGNHFVMFATAACFLFLTLSWFAGSFLIVSLPHCVLKRSSFPTARLTVHTNPLRKRSFSKTLFTEPEEFQNTGFAF